MLSTISDSDSELKLNIVDVHGDDGLLHRGCIVGVAHGGLIIDFDCKIEKVAYGKIYRSRQQSFFKQNEQRLAIEYRGSLVEVLLRMGPDKPNKWYPGTLLYGDNTKHHSFGLIRIYLSNRADCFAVPGNRFRTARTQEGLLQSVCKEGKLVDRDTVSEIQNRREVTKMEWYPAISQLDGLLLARYRSHNVEQLNQRVLRGDKRWLVVTDIGEDSVLYVRNVMASEAVQKRDTNRTWGFRRQLQKCACFAGFLSAQIFRTSCVLLEFYLRIDVYDDSDETSLYSLSRTVPYLAFLDSLNQVELRPVCKQWYYILTSESTRRVVRYKYSQKEGKAYRGEYELADCLLRCWNEDTQIIAIAGNDKSSMLRIGHYVQDIMQEKQRKSLRKLLLYNVRMENYRNADSDDFVDNLRMTLNPLAAVCSTLILNDVHMFRPGPLPIVIHLKRARITASQLDCDQSTHLWERLDKSCPDLEIIGRSTFTAWIRNFTDPERRKLYSRYRSADCDNLAKILTLVQGNDPRDSVHYRHKRWQPDDLVMLDLGKLTKLTGYALYALMHHNNMQIEVCW